MKYPYHLLQKDSDVITYLEVQSFEVNVYLVKITINNESGFVYDKKDSIMRFHSSQHIRDMFTEFTVEKSVMVHDSPYDEMIGNPPKQSDAMAMPFSMEQPY